MSILLVASVIANVLLGFALVRLFRVYQSSMRSADRQVAMERENTERARASFDHAAADISSLAEAVATSLESIRDDIDRNYHHIHEGHVFGQLAYLLRREVTERRGRVYGIRLDDDLVERMRSVGCEVSEQGEISLGQLLEAAWHLHSQARERANQLFEVVQQPCGNYDHASWLSKTLAIYELMCDRDKDLAVKRLTVAVDAWRHEPSGVVPRYVEDVR